MRLFRPALLAAASAAIILVTAPPASAQEASISQLDEDQLKSLNQADTSDNAISIYFRGGLAGRNIAEVLDSLYARVEGLPTRQHIIEPDGSVCKVLSLARYPSPCSPYLSPVSAYGTDLRL